MVLQKTAIVSMKQREMKTMVWVLATKTERSPEVQDPSTWILKVIHGLLQA